MTTTGIQPVDMHPPVNDRRVRRGRSGGLGRGGGIGLGLATAYLSIVVLLPLALLVSKAFDDGAGAFWDAITTPEAWAALKLTMLTGIGVAAVNAIMGTLIAWVLVRDQFPGKRALDTLIDLPFALPTIVAGIVIVALYGPSSPFGIDLAYKVSGVFFALLFVTLPFVVRTVQPVLLETDVAYEEAAVTLGATPWVAFRKVTLPALWPGIRTGTLLSFARALGEFGSIVIVSGNIPRRTLTAAVLIYGEIESGHPEVAAAVSTVLLGVAFGSIVIVEALQRRARHELA
jgi:sulfate/thiosulfate transport system permease protein